MSYDHCEGCGVTAEVRVTGMSAGVALCAKCDAGDVTSVPFTPTCPLTDYDSLTEQLTAITTDRDSARSDLSAITTDRDSARSDLSALIAESARIATKSGQALEHAAQAMERCVAERDAARAECERLGVDVEQSAIDKDFLRRAHKLRSDQLYAALADLARAQAVVEAAVRWREVRRSEAQSWKVLCGVDGDLYNAVDVYLAVQPGDGGGELLVATDPSPAELTAEVERLRAEVARMHPTYDAAKALCVEWFDTSGSMSQIDAIQDRAREVAMAAFAAIAQEQNVKPVDDESRCAACQRPLAASAAQGCVRGNCSQRPPPTNYYAPERAAREQAAMVRGVPTEERNRG